MRWSTRGLIVEPLGHGWSTTHAALPVPTVLADGSLRILYATRDELGRSRIARANVDLDAMKVDVDDEPVLDLGRLGAFDDSGVTPSCVVEREGRTFLYYTGWSLGQTVPFYLFAGCAVADGDGRFERVSSAPLLERDAVDPLLTASPWVLVEDDRWRMWYVSATEWETTPARPRHRYHIRYAESDDGLSWSRDGRVSLDFRDATEYAFGRPCVVRDDGLYRMWYCVRGDTYRIGYAESDDGLEWRRMDDASGIDLSASGWDSEMQAYPAFVEADRRSLLFYNGNGYGRDGVGWAVREP